MAQLVLADSNFYIQRARTGVDPFVELANANEVWEPATCGMVMLEVLRGRRDPALHTRFANAFSVMVMIPSLPVTWERTERLAWALDRKGVVLPAQDLLIAACALEADAALLTFDQHFRHIDGLWILEGLN